MNNSKYSIKNKISGYMLDVTGIDVADNNRSNSEFSNLAYCLMALLAFCSFMARIRLIIMDSEYAYTPDLVFSGIISLVFAVIILSGFLLKKNRFYQLLNKSVLTLCAGYSAFRLAVLILLFDSTLSVAMIADCMVYLLSLIAFVVMILGKENYFVKLSVLGYLSKCVYLICCCIDYSAYIYILPTIAFVVLSFINIKFYGRTYSKAIQIIYSVCVMLTLLAGSTTFIPFYCFI